MVPSDTLGTPEQPVSEEQEKEHVMSEKKKEAAGAQVAPAMGPPALINKEDIPQVPPILPLRNSVFFPGGVLPLAVGRQKTIALIKDAVRDEQVIGVVTQRRAEEEGLPQSCWMLPTIRRCHP